MTERSELAEAWSRQHIHACSCMGRRFVRINVPLEDPLFGTAIPCICQRDANQREIAQRLLRKSGIKPEELSRWDFAGFIPESCIPLNGQPVVKEMRRVKSDCEQYATHPRGWLILQGPRGAGKSHLAYSIAKNALGNSISVFCHSVPEILDLLRSGYNDGSYNSLLEDLMNVELLVLDDMGAQSDTPWANEKLFEIINARSKRLRPMVITTNANLDDDACGIDPRILSRLRDGVKAGIEGLVHILRMPVADYRPVNHVFKKAA